MASCLMTRAPIGSQKEDGTRKFVIRSALLSKKLLPSDLMDSSYA